MLVFDTLTKFIPRSHGEKITRINRQISQLRFEICCVGSVHPRYI